MTRRPWPLLQTLALGVVVLATPIDGNAFLPETRCRAAKIDAAARGVVSLFACDVDALATGSPTAVPLCRDLAARRLAKSFAAAQTRGGCVRTDDAQDVLDVLGEAATVAVAAVTAGPEADACAAAKLRATARLAARAFGCRARVLRRGQGDVAECIARAVELHQKALARAEKAGACADYAIDLVALADGLSGRVAALLTTGTPPDDPVPPSGLMVEVSGVDVALSWVPPPAVGGYVRILRRLNAIPIGPFDPEATVVFEGGGASAAESLTGLLPDLVGSPRIYHYVAFGCLPGNNCETVGSRATLAPNLSQVLRAGGYTIHWRHASATVCTDRTDLGPAATTSVPNWWKSCDDDCAGGTALARQLDATGRANALSMGLAIAARGFPFARSVTSEFCRAVETATLLDLGPALEERSDVTFFVYDESTRCANVLAILQENPAPGTNTALVGHAGLSSAACTTLRPASCAK